MRHPRLAAGSRRLRCWVASGGSGAPPSRVWPPGQRPSAPPWRPPSAPGGLRLLSPETRCCPPPAACYPPCQIAAQPCMATRCISHALLANAFRSTCLAACGKVIEARCVQSYSYACIRVPPSSLEGKLHQWRRCKEATTAMNLQ